ncbi:MAG: NADH dehydrogenase (quinone) subunit D [Acidobacteriaceae bacterium]|nr:NADH dehydrogenase (quinone) subunit D [Acidobacteriaceae bacterium]
MSPTDLLEKPEGAVEPNREPMHGRNTQISGATLTGFIPAEDLIIPDVKDVVEESASGRAPEGSDPVSDKTMVLNMGPQHPSTHGVLRLVIEIDGETVVSLAPDIGYLHTGIEKTCEAKFYNQVTPLTDRIDYLCPMTNNTAYALAVEKLLQLEIPEKAQWMRVLFNELTRIQSHLVWLGTHAMDIGALTVFLYCFREREELLRIFEAVSGQRMMTSYVRIGGVALEPPVGLFKKIRAFLEDFPSKIEQYEGLLQNNPIWIGRLKGIGYLTAEQAVALGVTGPPLRASGVDFDLRRDMPYSSYEKFQFNVPVATEGDVWARYIVRMQEMRESVKICLQALDGMPEGRIVAHAPKILVPDREQMKTQMESLIHHFKIVTEGFQVPAGEAMSAVEAPHGQMNYYVVSDGTAKPQRVHVRNADFCTLQALETMCKGQLIADVVAVIGSIDIVLGAIDR